jgi:hypothetical protein
MTRTNRVDHRDVLSFFGIDMTARTGLSALSHVEGE